jgi:fumarate hydratase class II
MNVYKPVMIYDVLQSIRLLSDGSRNFRKHLIEGTKPNHKRIKDYVDRSLMLVTALAPTIGYDKASKIAHLAHEEDLSLREAALKLGYVSEADYDRIVDPRKMIAPYVAKK